MDYCLLALLEQERYQVANMVIERYVVLYKYNYISFLILFLIYFHDKFHILISKSFSPCYFLLKCLSMKAPSLPSPLRLSNAVSSSWPQRATANQAQSPPPRWSLLIPHIFTFDKYDYTKL